MDVPTEDVAKENYPVLRDNLARRTAMLGVIKTRVTQEPRLHVGPPGLTHSLSHVILRVLR